MISSRESCEFFFPRECIPLNGKTFCFFDPWEYILGCEKKKKNKTPRQETTVDPISVQLPFHFSDRFFLFLSIHENFRNFVLYSRERERIFPRARWSRNNLTDVFPKYGKTGDTRRGCNRVEPRAAVWCKHWTLRPLKAHATQTCRWLLTRSTASITLRIVSFPSTMRTKFYSRLILSS